MATYGRMVQCIHCTHGHFMQWMRNPIICECDLMQERFVAEARRLCTFYEDAGTREPDITHYEQY